MPLSQAQLSFWLAQILDRDDPAFNIGECVEIHGAIDPQRFELALRQVVEESDALHLRIFETDNGPRQFFKYDPDWELAHLDFSSAANPVEVANAWMQKDMARTFRMDDGPLYRFALLKISPDRYFWYAVNHHIINDGVGWRLVVLRVASAYTAMMKGTPVEDQTGGSWRELLAEELAYKSSDHYGRDRKYWTELLADLPQRVTLSGKPARRPLGFIKHVGWIPHSLDLDAAGRRHEASAAAALVAAAAIYLHRMTGAREMMIATPVGARVGSKMRSIVGMTANAVPLRMAVSPDDRIADVVERAARGVRAALRHQRYRYEDMRRDLGLGPRDGEIAGTAVNFTPHDDIMFGDAAIVRNPLGNWWVEDLQIVFYGGDHPLGLRIDLIANPACYQPDDLAQHCDRFIELLSQIAVLPVDTPIARVQGLSPAERQRVLYDWNATDADYPSDRCIHELVEEQVTKTPEAVAVVFEDVKVSYSELNARANRLAHWLIAEGVKPDERVAIALMRGVEMVVALLATLKAGGAYVPLDPAYPVERLQFMLQDSAPRVLLTQESVLPGLGEIPAGLSVLSMDDAEETWQDYSSLNPDPRAMGLTSSNLAYVIYTSGSTGQPKGVDGLHRGLVNRLAWMATTFPFEDSGPALIKTSPAFIDGITELFSPLICGVTAVLADPKAGRSPAAIVEMVKRYAIGRLTVVPSLLATILEEGDRPRLGTCKFWITSGATLPTSLARRFYELLPNARLLNLYGTSEASGDSLFSVCTPDDVPIGQPIWNTQAYVLDEEMQPVPVGAAGLLYLAGVGLAAGYHGKPDLTADVFSSNPFGPPASRMYRTGDLARWRSNGTLEFLGRRDDQVKLNGIRIELGEIEEALRAQSGVSDVAVAVLEEGPDSKRLVAFIVCDPSGLPVEKSAIRAGLAKRLPNAFIPSAFIVLPKLPRLPNGKLDRRTLAESDIASGAYKPTTAPLHTPTEFALAEIWSDILRRPVTDRAADYFELGGDSLRATILLTRIQRAFGLDLPLKEVFETPTLEALASRVDAAAKESRCSSPVPAIQRFADDRPAPLSFSQHRMWLIQSLDPGNTAYNMAGATKLTGTLDAAALSRAIDELRYRHEILRTTYDVIDDEVVQRVQQWESEPLKIVDLTDEPDPEKEAVRRISALAQTPVDLASGPVFNCTLMRIGQDEHILQTTVHHIAGDQWSFGVLAREVASLYNAARSRRPAGLPAAQIRYRDFASWQRNWLESPEMMSQLQYWRRTLDSVPPLNLPTDRQRQRLPTLRGTYCQSSVPATLLEKLEQLGRRESTTLFMTMFAGFAVLLHRLAGQNDIPIGVPFANRTHSAVENVVGTFVNTLVLRVDLSGDPTFSELLGRVRTTALDSFAHQDMPFDKLVQEISYSRDTSRAPLVQVLFNMLNAPMYGIELDGIQWEPVLIDRGGAQFEISLSVDPQVTHTVTVEYNMDLFERATIERFIERYLCLLEGAIADPGKRLSELDILSPSERRLMLHTWNATSVPPPPRPFIAMFEERAAQLSDAVAVTFEGNSLTYGELNSRASAMALELRASGVGRGSTVGVCLERSLAMLVSLLAVQKSGGAYVPLDPKLPPQRLEYMVSDSGLRLVVATAETTRKLDLPPDVKVMEVGASAAEGLADAPDSGYLPSASDPAYIIYTSGSTGKPKGVVVSHGSLSNFLCSMQKEPGLAATDVLAAVTTISFDIAGLELYLPLLTGARIELVPSATSSDGFALSQLLLASGATVMQATPATWRMLLDAGWQGGAHFRTFCGGEALSRELADPLLERVGELWNLYGPTETTIWSTACRISPGDAPISVGKPIDNTRVYVLDGDTPAPIGIAGEICIGGDGVAVGYRGLPELTAERFQADPFIKDSYARIYRTGDLGRWGTDGLLYHMGRIDHQVKVRGFRIEPGEIETTIHAHPSVREAVVVAHEAASADTRLVAYVAYENGAEPTASDMRRHLRQTLPDYMVPSLIVALDSLPLTPNGKIDRSQLPDPFASTSEASTVGEEPAPGMETIIADLWREILKLDRVGAEDNFFDLGGYSLLALRVVTQIEKRTGARMDPRVLFFQNLRQIAAGLDDIKVRDS
ncbi:amino acid adenylation domain-containing protein [Hyphomicrobium sp.]|uniref:amino acid adenylation domain-containing protein n=1 Tax=Hyphomicrobium sp. TaxID=82 RepID=UPI003569ECE9